MSDFTIHIKKIIVTITDKTDRVSILTDMPSPYPTEVDDQDLSIDFATKKNSGVDYVREHFGIEPEIIDIRHNENERTTLDTIRGI